MTSTSVITEFFSKFETEAVSACIKILFLLVEKLFGIESWLEDEGALWEFWDCPFYSAPDLFFGLEKIQIKM